MEIKDSCIEQFIIYASVSLKRSNLRQLLQSRALKFLQPSKQDICLMKVF